MDIQFDLKVEPKCPLVVRPENPDDSGKVAQLLLMCAMINQGTIAGTAENARRIVQGLYHRGDLYRCDRVKLAQIRG